MSKRSLKVTEADLHFNTEISMKGLEEFDSEIERDRREGALLFLGDTGSHAVDALKRD